MNEKEQSKKEKENSHKNEWKINIEMFGWAVQYTHSQFRI